jgi:hypothetical protein
MWYLRVLEAIGNYLGKFLKADLSYLQMGRRTIVRALVGLQIYKGLAEKLPITSTSDTHIQLLDYEGIHFRCHQCHGIGHMWAQCPKVAHLQGKVLGTSGS